MFILTESVTYNMRGAKTVNAKTDRSGWDKWQATLVLYIFADGIPRIRPKLIFHGKATDEGGKIEECESHLYHKDVSVLRYQASLGTS